MPATTLPSSRKPSMTRWNGRLCHGSTNAGGSARRANDVRSDRRCPGVQSSPSDGVRTTPRASQSLSDRPINAAQRKSRRALRRRLLLAAAGPAVRFRRRWANAETSNWWLARSRARREQSWPFPSPWPVDRCAGVRTQRRRAYDREPSGSAGGGPHRILCTLNDRCADCYSTH
jgi:hypothetical protein